MPALHLLLEYSVAFELADEEGETPLHTAARTSTLERCQFCFSQCGDASAVIQQRTLGGDSLLHYATAGARQDIVEFLLAPELGADSTTKNGWTPLHCAIMPLSH
jgi:ankyrin repeat protein